MFKGLKLSTVSFESKSDTYYQEGLKLFENHEALVKKTLVPFFLKDNSLDATKIINSWFPEFKAHVFISHSHRDNTKAIELAGYLKLNYGLTSFIDSCIWGYANNLIKSLDDKFSWSDNEKKTYDYREVLNSTSHVHMMLMTSLASMIDKTECLIFYETPNSIVKYEGLDKTESPWIYSEIALSQIVRLTEPPRLKNMILEQRKFSLGGTVNFEKGFNAKYDISTKHLQSIDHDTLNQWAKFSNQYKGEDALDRLYEIAFLLPNLIK